MSDAVTLQTAVEQLIEALTEGFEDTNNPWSYFLDKGTGFYATLAKISSKQASKSIGNNSIASQVAHVIFGLNVTSDFISGKRERVDWTKSWEPKVVNEEEWQDLQSKLQQAYQRAKQTIKDHATDDVMSIGGAVSVVTHLAYHLGAIRQKLALIQSE